MRISDICTHDVITCAGNVSALEVARLMRECHVGDVVVVTQVDSRKVPAGVVTDRDLVVQVLAKGIDPDRLTASDVMSQDLTTALGSEPIYDAIWHMRGRGIRRLPVVDSQGSLIGMLTADDVTRFLASELSEISQIGPHQLGLEKAAHAASTKA